MGNCGTREESAVVSHAQGYLLTYFSPSLSLSLSLSLFALLIITAFPHNFSLSSDLLLALFHFYSLYKLNFHNFSFFLPSKMLHININSSNYKTVALGIKIVQFKVHYRVLTFGRCKIGSSSSAPHVTDSRSHRQGQEVQSVHIRSE